MTRVLHVQASPGARSHSAAAATAFLETLKQQTPDAQIDTIDVWSIDLPAFDATMIEAKFAVLRAQNASEEQRRRWQEAVAIARRFNSADLYVFSLPMWNYGVPYRLKRFIDVVTLPGENWTWSRERGYEALLGDFSQRWVTAFSVATRSCGPFAFACSAFCVASRSAITRNAGEVRS